MTAPINARPRVRPGLARRPVTRPPRQARHDHPYPAVFIPLSPLTITAMIHVAMAARPSPSVKSPGCARCWQGWRRRHRGPLISVASQQPIALMRPARRRPNPTNGHVQRREPPAASTRRSEDSGPGHASRISASP